MRIRPSHKAVIVALATTAWLTHTDPGTWSTITLAFGATSVAFAWIMLPAPQPTAPAPVPATARGCFEPRHGPPGHRLSRRPTRRGPRDVRCPASRATARARRSTRR